MDSADTRWEDVAGHPGHRGGPRESQSGELCGACSGLRLGGTDWLARRPQETVEPATLEEDHEKYERSDADDCADGSAAVLESVADNEANDTGVSQAAASGLVVSTAFADAGSKNAARSACRPLART